MIQQKNKLELFQKTVDFLNSSNLEDEELYDLLCDFFVDNLEFEAAVIFKVLHDDKLLVAGSSRTALKKYARGSIWGCIYCPALRKKGDFGVASDARCELIISDNLIYEACAGFSFIDGEIGFIKLTQRSPFSNEEFEFINGLVSFIKFVFGYRLKPEATEGNRGRVMNGLNSELLSFLLKKMDKSKEKSDQIISGFNAGEISQIEKTKILSSLDLKLTGEKTLFDLNELLTKGPVPDIEEFSLGTLIEKVSERLKHVLDSRNNRIKIEFDREEEILTESSPFYLDYIMSRCISLCNLLNRDRELQLSVETDSGREIKISIYCGNHSTDEEILMNIFRPSRLESQLDLSRSELSPVSFLVVRKFIDRLEGSFKVIPADSGTVFEIMVPANVRYESRYEKHDIEPHEEGREHPGILVVEDDYTASKLLNSQLVNSGFSPVLVNKPEQVFERLQEEKFAAVIVDIYNPNCNTLELLNQVNRFPSNKRVPVLLCAVGPEDRKVFSMGEMEYLSKPPDHGLLIDIIRNYRLRDNSLVLVSAGDLTSSDQLKECVEKAGHKTAAFTDSSKVISEIENQNIDLALIDLEIPDPDGFDLLKKIKSIDRFSDLPVIIFSGVDKYDYDLGRLLVIIDELLSDSRIKTADLSGVLRSMMNRYYGTAHEDEGIKDLSSKKILLAEDYKHSQIIVTRLLRKNGFDDVIIVENGEDAIEQAKNEDFALVLMDMQMPVLDGFEAIKKMRALPNHEKTPIIALTAFALQGEKEKCFEAGATDYLSKPIDSKELIDKIRIFIPR